MGGEDTPLFQGPTLLIASEPASQRASQQAGPEHAIAERRTSPTIVYTQHSILTISLSWFFPVFRDGGGGAFGALGILEPVAGITLPLSPVNRWIDHDALRGPLRETRGMDEGMGWGEGCECQYYRVIRCSGSWIGESRLFLPGAVPRACADRIRLARAPAEGVDRASDMMD